MKMIRLLNVAHGETISELQILIVKKYFEAVRWRFILYSLSFDVIKMSVSFCSSLLQ